MAFDHTQLADALLRASAGRCRYDGRRLEFASREGARWAVEVDEDVLRTWLQRLALSGDGGEAASEVTEHDAVAIRAVRVLDSRVFDGVHPLKDIAAAHQRRPSAEAPRPWHVRHDSIDDPGRQRSTTRGG